MNSILFLIDFIIHLDKHINTIIVNYGTFTYLILFLIVFCETGLVVTPFLPGDSLLFIVGALSASNTLSLLPSAFLLVIAAILGDSVNYYFGKLIGPKIFCKDNIRFLKKEYLIITHKFYEKHGGKTIIFARFMPIIRTFAPFVAGIGKMNYFHFLLYNIIGGFLWVILFIIGGYFFGNIPIVKNNFTLVIFAIIFISLLPGIITFIKSKIIKNKEI